MHSTDGGTPGSGLAVAGLLAACCLGIRRMEADMKVRTLLPHSFLKIAALGLVAGTAALSGCMMEPRGPSPIYSRLPADQSGIAATAQPLTPEERARYDAID